MQNTHHQGAAEPVMLGPAFQTWRRRSLKKLHDKSRNLPDPDIFAFDSDLPLLLSVAASPSLSTCKSRSFFTTFFRPRIRGDYYNEKCPHPPTWEHLYCKPFQMKHSLSCIYQHHRFPIVNSKNLCCKRPQQERRSSCERCDTCLDSASERFILLSCMTKSFHYGNFASQIFACSGVGGTFHCNRDSSLFTPPSYKFALAGYQM